MKKDIIKNTKINIGASSRRLHYKGITLISLVITIIIILILAGVGISGSLALIEEAKYTAHINECKQITEAMQIYLLNRQLEMAQTEEEIDLYEEFTQITKVGDIPESLQAEINYIRAILEAEDEENKEEIIESLPTSYAGDDLEIKEKGSKLYFLPDDLSGGKHEAYIYDEQSASVYKVEPTIVWGIEMYGYEYGNLLVSNSGLLQKAKEEADVVTPPPEPKDPTIADYTKEAVNQNTYTNDKYGNPIVIPAGFRVVPHDEDYVVYDYDIEDNASTNTPVVQDGIVIEDKDGNQFVWIPVGEIKNDAVENTINTTNIQLGRYYSLGSDFSGFTMDTSTTIPTPPEPFQIADDWSKYTGAGSYIEYDKSNTTYKNTKAHDLGGWLETTQKNGGYYIARYEASYGENGAKALSQPSIGIPSPKDGSAPTTKGQLWNFITQSNASKASQNMYPNQTVTNAEYYSDLVNSYAWETAIIFIQTYSGNVTYATNTSVYTDSSKSQPANTGERGSVVEVAGSENTIDKVCNIYDMASNVVEYSTETCIAVADCVYKGGTIYTTTFGAGSRSNYYYGSGDFYISFRPILYVRSEK